MPTPRGIRTAITLNSLKGTLLPQLDAACSSLVTDLAERGMLKERTIVAVFGDFGRTRSTATTAAATNWNFCYSLMMLGGGFKAGRIYGSSDATGAFPPAARSSPATSSPRCTPPWEFPTNMKSTTSFARPHRLVPAGDVVSDLLA